MWLTVTEMLIKNSKGLMDKLSDIIKWIFSEEGGRVGGGEGGGFITQTDLPFLNHPSSTH